jgi:hypothetical protein
LSAVTASPTAIPISRRCGQADRLERDDGHDQLLERRLPAAQAVDDRLDPGVQVTGPADQVPHPDDQPPVDPYLERKQNGRRAIELPDIRKFLA